MRSHGLELTAASTKRARLTRLQQVGVIGAVAMIAVAAAACGGSSPTSGSSGTKPASFNTLITEGQAAQNAGDSSQAETYYDQALVLEPNNAIALYDLGDLEQVNLKEPAQAEANYTKALKTNPDFVNDLFNLAILVTQANPTEAEGYYERVLRIKGESTNAAAHLNLGYVEITLGDTAAGDAQIREAARLHPAYANRVPTGSSGSTATTTTTTTAKTTTTVKTSGATT